MDFSTLGCEGIFFQVRLVSNARVFLFLHLLTACDLAAFQNCRPLQMTLQLLLMAYSSPDHIVALGARKAWVGEWEVQALGLGLHVFSSL